MSEDNMKQLFINVVTNYGYFGINTYNIHATLTEQQMVALMDAKANSDETNEPIHEKDFNRLIRTFTKVDNGNVLTCVDLAFRLDVRDCRENGCKECYGVELPYAIKFSKDAKDHLFNNETCLIIDSSGDHDLFDIECAVEDYIENNAGVNSFYVILDENGHTSVPTLDESTMNTILHVHIDIHAL